MNTPLPNIIDMMEKAALNGPSFKGSLSRDESTGSLLDHPRLDRRCFLKDVLFDAKGAHRVSGHLDRLEPIISHEARAQRGFVDRVTPVFGPFVEEFDRVIDAFDLPHKVLTLLQIDGSVEGRLAHILLTICQHFQRLSRLFSPAIGDLRKRLRHFKGAFA